MAAAASAGHTTTVEHHPPLEEYLQTIETLTEEGAPVIQARIAERLGKSAPSVSEMLDRLTTDGYVDRSGRQIALTAEGHAVAQSVIRKHRLAECLLVDVIGLPWHLVHEEAGRWEHVMSDDVEERLVELLGDPATCPHGNPIPGSANRVATTSTQVRLAEVENGQRVRFERMTEEIEQDGASLRYLNDVGFIPGTSATVTTKAPDGTCILDVEGETVALGREFAQRLFVVARLTAGQESGAEHHVQSGRAAHHEELHPLVDVARGQGHGRKVVEHGVEGDDPFESGQWRAHTEVDPEIEGQVPAGGGAAGHVELFGVRAHGGVAAPRGQAEHQHRSGGDPAPAHRGIGNRLAEDNLHRGQMPQRLLDRRRDKIAILAQPLVEAVLRKDLEEEIADEMGRGLDAADQHVLREVRQDPLVGNGSAVVVTAFDQASSRDRPGDHPTAAVVRMTSRKWSSKTQAAGTGRVGLLRPGMHLGEDVVVRVGPHQVQVLLGDARHAADDQGR